LGAQGSAIVTAVERGSSHIAIGRQVSATLLTIG
jgi:hypothetical protein